MKLHDKVALVTGAGSGIGLAIVKLFIEEGAKVVATDIQAERLVGLQTDVAAAGHADRLTIVAGNVAVQAAAENMIDVAVNTYGTLDILVNNAGIMDEFVPLADLEDAMWRQVLAVNLDGPMYLSRKALRVMLAKESGVIVNVSSIGGLFGGRSGVTDRKSTRLNSSH